MKKNIKLKGLELLALIVILISAGCEDYFTNPLKDKESGEDINLIILDFNFFKTRMTYQLHDAKTGGQILAEATIKFSGKNGNDIVNFSGKKNVEYKTSQGQLELTVDPNVAVSATTPLEYNVTVEVKGYNALIKPVSVSSEGFKTIDLVLVKLADENQTNLNGNLSNSEFHFGMVTDGLKSARTSSIPFKINYGLTIQNILKFTDELNRPLFKTQDELMAVYNKDPQNFIKLSVSTYNSYPSGIEPVNLNGTMRNALFQKLETGKITGVVIGGKNVVNFNGGIITANCVNATDFLPKIFGFASFEINAWKISGTSVEHKSLNSTYTLATVSTDVLCDKGATVSFKSNIFSGFSFVADAYDADNNLITTLYFKGNLPQSFVLENVPSKSAKLVFRNNNPSIKPISNLQVTNLCSGNYDVFIEPAEGYLQYQIVLRAHCRDNSAVAIAPTYSAEVKIRNSTDPWQTVTMKGGVVDLLGKPNMDYEMRLLWNSDWEYSDYSTKFDVNGHYLGKPDNDATVVSKMLEDGRIQILVDKIFEQNICDDINW